MPNRLNIAIDFPVVLLIYLVGSVPGSCLTYVFASVMRILFSVRVLDGAYARAAKEEAGPEGGQEVQEVRMRSRIFTLTCFAPVRSMNVSGVECVVMEIWSLIV